MNVTIEVLETSTGIIEVIEQGPQGTQGPQGPQGDTGTTFNPLLSLLTHSLDTLVIPLHDGTEATEITLPFNEIITNELIVNGSGLEVLVDINGFSASMEIHTLAEAPAGKVIQLLVWSEVSVDGGVTWSTVPNSLFMTVLADTESGGLSFSLHEGNNIPAGTKIRLKMTKLGSNGTTLTLKPAITLATSKGDTGGYSTKATMFYRVS